MSNSLTELLTALREASPISETVVHANGDLPDEWVVSDGHTMGWHRKIVRLISNSECGVISQDEDGTHYCAYPTGHRPGDEHGFDYLLKPDRNDVHWCVGYGPGIVHETPFGHWFAPDRVIDWPTFFLKLEHEEAWESATKVDEPDPFAHGPTFEDCLCCKRIARLVENVLWPPRKLT